MTICLIAKVYDQYIVLIFVLVSYRNKEMGSSIVPGQLRIMKTRSTRD